MMKKILFITFLILLSSCKQQNKLDNLDSFTAYDLSDSPEYKIEYYKNSENKPLRIQIFKEDYDSIIFKYRNGNIFKEGKLTKNGIRFGKWNLYDNSGILREIREFINFNGKPILNRVWFLNEKGDTLAWREQDSIFNQPEFLNDTIAQRNTTFNYFHFSKDTLNITEPLRAIAEINTQPLDKYGSTIIVLLAKEDNNFNEDFSNYREVKFDTFLSAAKDTLNRFMFRENQYDKVVAFWRKFNTPGKKILRGYVQEKTDSFPYKEDSVGTAYTRTFFEKEVYVQDTIN